MPVNNPLPAKRKASSPNPSGDEEADVGQAAGSASTSKPRGGSELVPSTKPGEPPVTKRTLQNRKAQREFRKRREARVKELEERCRRFDQVGFEANTELQRVARRFKDENEALRGLLIRLGHGGLIQNALEGLNHKNFGRERHDTMQSNHQGGQLPHGPFSNIQPPTGSVNPNMLDPMRFGDSGEGDVGRVMYHNQPQLQAQAPPPPPQQQQQQQQQKLSHYPHHQQPHHHPSQSQSQNVSSMASPSQSTIATQQHAGMTVRWPKDQQVWVQPSLPRRERSASNRSGEDKSELLSLKLGSDGSNSGRPAGTPSSRTSGLTTATFNNLMGMLTGQQPITAHNPDREESTGRGGGSAFIKKEQQGSTPLAHRPHQNDALLNPNPIPFALNLSNEPLPDQSWWDRNGGGMFGGDSFLDDKAQAVAQAQAHSPFYLSSFLTTGATPGIAGYGSGMPTGFTPALGDFDALGEAGAELKESSRASGSGKSNGKKSAHKIDPATLGPAEHIQTFLRLLERQAIKASQLRRDEQQRRQTASTAASTWLDMGSDATSAGSSDEDRRDERPSSSRSADTKEELITPMAAYSRLAQHPAFMRTDAKELEEMVSTIHQASIATVHGAGSAPLELRAGTLNEMLKVLDRKHAASLGHRYGSGGGGAGDDASTLTL